MAKRFSGILFIFVELTATPGRPAYNEETIKATAIKSMMPEVNITLSAYCPNLAITFRGDKQMQFMVLGYDGNDKDALARRMAVRQEHLDRNDGLRDKGNLLYAVAILDDAEKMIGSCMIFEFPTRQDLDEWLKQEPYVTGDVWRRIEISPCRIGPSFAHTVHPNI